MGRIVLHGTHYCRFTGIKIWNVTCPPLLFILNSENLNQYVETVGSSMTFQLEVKIYFVRQDKPKTVVREEEALKISNNLSLDKTSSIEEKVDSNYELGDAKTSDVTISVTHEDKQKFQVFFCHSAVLSGTILRI